jgi:Flp pilus assembly pilin Flp
MFLLSQLRRFARDSRGSVNIEAILFFPLLVGLIAASMVFYDGFRRDSLTHKAAFTVGDMVSRETTALTPDYLAGARSLTATLVGAEVADVSVRLTQVTYNARRDRLRANWSHAAGPHTGPLSNAQLRDRAADLPPLAHGERVILVDVFVDHDWAMDVGLSDGTFLASAVTRPRFAPRLAWAAE